MPWTSEHTKWLVDTGERLKTADGKKVEVWEFRHEKDEAVLSAWAKHFRNHYCLDAEIDFLRGKRPRPDYGHLYKVVPRVNCCVGRCSKSSCTSCTLRFLRSVRLALDSLTTLFRGAL